jgi:cell shape-determining protein MreC
MKKLVMIFVLSLASSFAFSQNSASISETQLKSGKSNGVYEFTVPESITSNKVDAVKGYYKDYYTVDFNETTDKLKITLLKNEEMNINVMNRLLVALDLRTISVNGQEMTFQDMKDKYLK